MKLTLTDLFTDIEIEKIVMDIIYSSALFGIYTNSLPHFTSKPMKEGLVDIPELEQELQVRVKERLEIMNSYKNVEIVK